MKKKTSKNIQQNLFEQSQKDDLVVYCKKFGCGKPLNLQEQFAGDYCFHHAQELNQSKSCSISCSASDYKPNGKCSLNGCYEKPLFSKEKLIKFFKDCILTENYYSRLDRLENQITDSYFRVYLYAGIITVNESAKNITAVFPNKIISFDLTAPETDKLVHLYKQKPEII